MNRTVTPILGILLLAVSGLVHGVQTGRWRDPEVLRRAAAKLDSTPRQFGKWTSQPLELSERQLKVAEAEGGLAARYETFDPQAGPRSVEVMFLCGPFGPIAVHPPTVCFRGVGYRQVSDQKRVEVNDASGKSIGQFWATDFERTVNGSPQRIRTWWGWSDGESWSAPQNPRLTFAGTAVLYKIYFTETLHGEDAQSVIPVFAESFLPELRDQVFQGNS